MTSDDHMDRLDPNFEAQKHGAASTSQTADGLHAVGFADQKD